MYQPLIIIHILISLSIIGLVLLQQGRGADAGAGFSGGASGTLFGARGTGSFLSRTTAILAALFFASSMLLAYLGGKRDNDQADVITTQQSSAPQGAQDLPTPDNSKADPGDAEPAGKTDLPAPAQP